MAWVRVRGLSRALLGVVVVVVVLVVYLGACVRLAVMVVVVP